MPFSVQSCALCGKAYLPKEQSDGRGFQVARYASSTYCSRDCFHEARRRSAAERLITDTKKCEYCGESYGRNGRKPKAFSLSKYCSAACTGKAQQNADLNVLSARLRIDSKTGCHNWTGNKTHAGYGMARFHARTWLIHRLLWEHANGPVPEGLQLDHLCNNTSCCNIKHLRVVTPQENSLARNFRRHGGNCPKCSIPYSQRPNGDRYCKPCCRIQQTLYLRQYRARKKAAALAIKEKELNGNGI